MKYDYCQEVGYNFVDEERRGKHHSLRDRWYHERQDYRQLQILRLTTPKLKKALGAPFAQDDSFGALANWLS